MIVGLVGSIASGKEALAQYLKDNYGYECINLLELFKERYGHLFELSGELPSPLKKKEGKEKMEGNESEGESFCFEYFMGKRVAFIHYKLQLLTKK